MARPRKERRYTEADIRRLYCDKRLTLRQVAEALGVQKDTLNKDMIEFGIPRRARTAKASTLDIIPLELIETGIKSNGLRGHARHLGVHASTLLRNVRTRRARAAAKSK